MNKIDEERFSALRKELDNLHRRLELSKTKEPDFFEPGLMEYLDRYEGKYDPSTDQICMRFSVMGTRYEGRTERIETTNVGDPVIVLRDNTNEFNTNNFTIVDKKNNSLGNMPAALCNALAPLYDDGAIEIEKSFVSFADPISKRSRHAKQAVLFVELDLKLL